MNEHNRLSFTQDHKAIQSSQAIILNSSSTLDNQPSLLTKVGIFGGLSKELSKDRPKELEAATPHKIDEKDETPPTQRGPGTGNS